MIASTDIGRLQTAWKNIRAALLRDSVSLLYHWPMPAPEFFEDLGLFVRRGFFDLEFCAEMRREAVALAARSEVVVGGAEAVDEQQRRSRRAAVPERHEQIVRDRFAALTPELEQHFGTELRSFETPQFLVYETGDCFKVHRDGFERGLGPDYVRRRKVSVVAFLNGPSVDPRPDCFGGGELCFYRLDPKAALRDIRQPLIAECGLLVGFRSEVFHEVAQVTFGRRQTIVSWYH